MDMLDILYLILDKAEKDGMRADQSDKEEMDKKESECMHCACTVHFYSVIASIFRFTQM